MTVLFLNELCTIAAVKIKIKFAQITLVFDSNNDDNTITINAASKKTFNRAWIRFYAEENEHFYGGKTLFV